MTGLSNLENREGSKMLEDWTNFLPANGSKIVSPSLPDGSMALDSNIEANGLGANSLYGNFNSVLGVGGGSSGGGYVRVDSANQRIISNDGINNRVLIGKF